jgi:hypothetical protein
MPAFGAEKILTREEIVGTGRLAPRRLGSDFEMPPTATGPDRLSAASPLKSGRATRRRETSSVAEIFPDRGPPGMKKAD